MYFNILTNKILTIKMEIFETLSLFTVVDFIIYIYYLRAL